jgi:hypothetical protein
MLHVSSSSQTLRGGRNFDERPGGVLRVDLSVRTGVSQILRFRSFWRAVVLPWSRGIFICL